MNRTEKLSLIKSMIDNLRLIITNESIAYKYSNYLIVDDFVALLCNDLYNVNYEVSNYLENEKYPFELIERNKKRITQILLSSDDASILEAFDTFELLLETHDEFIGYSLYIILVGIDEIESLNQLNNALREYQFDFQIYNADDVVHKLSTTRDFAQIDRYINFISTESYKFGPLLNVRCDVMDKLMVLLSRQHNFVSSTPTIFPKTSREYYENTSNTISLELDDSIYYDIIVVLNGYSRHELGAKYCIGAVYSYIRNVWIREDIAIDVIPNFALKQLTDVIYHDIKHNFGSEEYEVLERLIRAIMTEAFLRLKVDFNLYE